jgi:nucleotide-binding universal stress UspA family protein
MITIQNVLVPIDFSEPSEAALRFGHTLAAQFGATLHVLHVVEDLALKTITAEGFVSYMPDLQREIEEAAQTRLKTTVAGLTAGSGKAVKVVTSLVTSNTTAESIGAAAKAAQIDVIVIGTHGRSGVSRLLLGSVAERVVRTAPCPVLTVHRDAGAPGTA